MTVDARNLSQPVQCASPAPSPSPGSAGRRRSSRLVHDLRSPLNGIVGAASMLRHAAAQGDPERLAHMLDIIETSSRHLLELVDALLDTPGAQSPLRPDLVLLPPLLRRCLQIIEAQAQRKGVALELAFDPSLDHIALPVDALALRRVLVNLLGNAARFTDQGTIRLSAGLEPATGLLRVLHIAVQDSGQGMFEHQLSSVLASLLGRAARLPASVVQRGGTGIGLPLTDQLLRAMGSHLRIESKPGVGTRTWFLLSV